MLVAGNTEKFVSRSPEETEAIAAGVAGRLEPGDIVLLSGELGSGKTAFVRGAARALGVTGPVTSPTFAIGNVYDAGAMEVAHVDMYRLEQVAMDDEMVLGDFLTPARIAFVEWPHAELEEPGGHRLSVRLEHAGGDERAIHLDWKPA